MLAVTALSASRSVLRDLGPAPVPLQVLAVFDHACDFIAADGQVICLVSQAIGDGPLNIVMPGPLPRQMLPASGAAASISARRLSVGELEIGLDCPQWEPHPDWGFLRSRIATVCASLPVLATHVQSYAPPRSLLALLDAGDPAQPSARRVLDAVRRAGAHLAPGQSWSPEQAGLAAAEVAGLGWGLTPCGDDWLAGVLAWAWLAHPAPAEVGEAVLRAVSGRTSHLSLAFLRGAARGECDAAWHGLLGALAAGEPCNVDAALRAVLAHGATSGADRLAGFLSASGDSCA